MLPLKRRGLCSHINDANDDGKNLGQVRDIWLRQADSDGNIKTIIAGHFHVTWTQQAKTEQLEWVLFCGSYMRDPY